MYVFIKGDEDSNPFNVINEPLDEFLSNAREDYSISEFKDATFLKEHSDPNYWPEGVAVLAKLEVIVPKPVTSKWAVGE